jgi:hypothetical protein
MPVTKPIINNNETKIEEETQIKIGQVYQINISHINSIDNFFVNLSSSLLKKANLMNNLDNYYRNNLSDQK